MKQQMSYLALVASALLLQACGGSMLGTSDAEDHKLIPDPVSDDPNRPRPSQNAPVITTDERIIVDATGEPVLLRGVNLNFGDDPLERIDSIVPIREVGSNVVRLVLRETTTAAELEAALLEVVEQDLIAVLTLWEPDLSCTANSERLFGTFSQRWAGTWWPILVQDRFQPHIMINLASAWGPDNIFNAYSLGYRVYIDNYKALIGQLRNYGLKVPLVIDAPGCGQDYHAFLGNRGRELLAADSEKNLVLSVHGYGSRWRTGNNVAAAMRLLEAERMPILMSEFGDFNAEENAVRHMEILDKGVGDYAAALAIDWQTGVDKAAYIVTLAEPLNVQGREVSMEVYLAAAYVENGAMGLQVYLRDTEDRYANLGWNSTGALNADSWTTLRRTIQDESSFGWMQDDFDMTAVDRIGVELVANGKEPEVMGEIRIDNIKVIEASVPELLHTFDFESGVDGWAKASWDGAPDTTIVAQDGALGLIRGAEDGEVLVFSDPIPGVTYDGEIQVNAQVFIPESYAAETTGIYFTFVTNSAGWQSLNYLGGGDLTFGEWNNVTLSGTWSGGSDLGIQMGGLAGSHEPILFDDIMIFGMPEEELAVEWGVQYQSDFSEGTDGWGVLGWHTLPITVSAEDGYLVMLPRPSETTPGDNDRITFAVQKADLATVENFNLDTESMVMSLTLQLDAAYASAPEEFEFRLFIQDSNWSNHFNIAVWTIEDLNPGEWVTFEVEVDFPEAFSRTGTPQHFGFQVFGIYDMPNAPIRVAELRIEGDVPVESLEDVVDIVDFHYAEHFDRLSVDFVEGGLSDVVLMEGISSFERSKPFNWIAAHWIGSPEGYEVLDLSESVDTSVSLTERGEQIVNGKGGIQETSVLASFP